MATARSGGSPRRGRRNPDGPPSADPGSRPNVPCARRDDGRRAFPIRARQSRPRATRSASTAAPSVLPLRVSPSKDIQPWSKPSVMRGVNSALVAQQRLRRTPGVRVAMGEVAPCSDDRHLEGVRLRCDISTCSMCGRWPKQRRSNGGTGAKCGDLRKLWDEECLPATIGGTAASRPGPFRRVSRFFLAGITRLRTSILPY